MKCRRALRSRFSAVTLATVAAYPLLFAASGCELIASVDRSQIGDNAEPSGGSTSGGTGGRSAAGGAAGAGGDQQVAGGKLNGAGGSGLGGSGSGSGGAQQAGAGGEWPAGAGGEAGGGGEAPSWGGATSGGASPGAGGTAPSGGAQGSGGVGRGGASQASGGALQGMGGSGGTASGGAGSGGIASGGAAAGAGGTIAGAGGTTAGAGGTIAGAGGTTAGAGGTTAGVGGTGGEVGGGGIGGGGIGGGDIGGTGGGGIGGTGGGGGGGSGPSTKLIYLTSMPKHANFGGVVGADAQCNANPPTVGTFKALLVDGASRVACTSPNCATDGADEGLDWVLAPNTTYVRADGTTVIGTTNSAGVFVFPLQASIGSEPTSYWTGLSPDWTTSIDTCAGWTETSGVIAVEGLPDAVDGAAIAGLSESCAALGGAVFACVEQ